MKVQVTIIGDKITYIQDGEPVDARTGCASIFCPSVEVEVMFRDTDHPETGRGVQFNSWQEPRGRQLFPYAPAREQPRYAVK
jgi:hypothetical protein